MAIECITFDLDDTLWECTPVLLRAEERLRRWLLEHCPRIRVAGDEAALLAHRQAYYERNPELAHDLSALRRGWLAALLAEHGYRAGLAETAFALFLEERNRVELYPGAAETLERLARRYALGAITNGNADCHRIGIADHFDFVITAAAVGAAKPAPRIFQAALAAAGVEPARAVHVGDDPERDVLAAATVGMRAVWVNPRLRPWPGGAQPDAVVRGVCEVEALLEGW